MHPYNLMSGFSVLVKIVEVESGDFKVVVTEESHYGIAFRAWLHVGFNAFEGIERRRVALLNMTVAFRYVVDGVLIH